MLTGSSANSLTNVQMLMRHCVRGGSAIIAMGQIVQSFGDQVNLIGQSTSRMLCSGASSV